jgi:Rieske Fe-S protein
MKDTILSSSPALSRRNFLELAWKGLLGLSSALGLAGLVRFLSHQPYPTPLSRFDLGPYELIDRQKASIINEAQAVLIPTAGGFEAYSLVCPHLGCLVELKKDHFLCPCHSSRFDLKGQVLKGPSDQPLRRLQIEVNEEGRLILDIR